MSRPEFDGSYLTSTVVLGTRDCYKTRIKNAHSLPPRVCLREKHHLNFALFVLGALCALENKSCERRFLFFIGVVM